MKSWLFRFACALRGLGHTLAREPAGQVHAVCAVAVIVMGVALDVSATEWAVLSLATASVIAAEAMNSAVERLTDRVSTEREESIRILKDSAAGAVLAASLGAAGAALAIFGPKLLEPVSR
jgi:diacylglycerol kinase (ATP)